ncbi:RANBP17 [Mytilus coruscus]|uniref:RANBP17 n=1 Tax=Mytilus coruscus TaxID=42192 RepID=A0A6J8DTS6_MYTCO|nr:RANBP17 [Mytilus coruscus]
MKEWYFSTVEIIVKQHVFLQTITTGAKQQMLEVDGQCFRLVLENGKTITLMKKTISKSKKGDKISNYGNQILQLGLLFKDLIDMIHMPERVRGIRLLKLAMMYFKVYNNLSKYALEILRLPLHQLCTLSEKGSNEEFYSMFVNTGGKFDTHIPADRRMEYLVKEVKKTC